MPATVNYVITRGRNEGSTRRMKFEKVGEGQWRSTIDGERVAHLVVGEDGGLNILREEEMDKNSGSRHWGYLRARRCRNSGSAAGRLKSPPRMLDNVGGDASENSQREHRMSSDVVRLICPNLKCRSILSAPVAARGKTVRCSKCGIKVRIPDSSAPQKPAPADTTVT